MALKLLLPLFLSLLVVAAAAKTPSSGDITWWCDQTPYPEPCKHFMSNNKRTSHLPKHKSDFRKMAVKLALERAITAEGSTKALGSKCRNSRERAAWADCVTLYKETIEQLNKTADPSTRCTDFDAQTWLSAALTNLETCRTGFAELGVADFVLPLMSNNVSKLICNTLALGESNETTHETSAYYKDDLPKWVRPRDRRLLQATAVRPNLVVAQDGSGHHRTIKAALDAAARRSGSGRFVIHVKRGVYRENLEIEGSKLRNIMLVGDGLRYTFITGSRSVGGGSTTFNSATVGKSLPRLRQLIFYCNSI